MQENNEKSFIRKCHEGKSFKRIQNYVGTCLFRSANRNKKRQEGLFRFQKKSHGRWLQHVSVLVGIMSITDKQFGMMEIFQGKKLADPVDIPQQLELF